jgi:hypothetical protein
MTVKSKFSQMEKSRKIFLIIAITLGSIALIGFVLAAVGLSYGYSGMSLGGFILIAPLLVFMAVVWISYARV